MSSKIMCGELKCSCSSVCMCVGVGGGGKEEGGRGRVGGKEESLKVQIVR